MARVFLPMVVEKAIHNEGIGTETRRLQWQIGAGFFFSFLEKAVGRTNERSIDSIPWGRVRSSFLPQYGKIVQECPVFR
jgi:hypothetical protein